MIDYDRLLIFYNIPHKLDVEGWINIFCPYHDNGKRGFKGGINLTGNYYYCWSCGGEHNLNEVLEKVLNVSFYKLQNILEEYETVINIKFKKKKASGKNITLPIEELNSIGKDYLIKRKFDPDFIYDKYKVTGCLISGTWSYRLIIPIYLNGKLISFQGRSIFSKNKCDKLEILRYKNYSIEQSIVDPKTILYNIDNCKKDYILIVEGVPDVWRIGDNCAATLGTSVSESEGQIPFILSRNFKRVFILFDPEKEAQKRAKKLGKKLSITGIDTIIVNTELNRDPGAMTEREVKELKGELGI
jgi:DNA primase